MPFYRLYFLDESSRISGGHELQCGDDRQAREHAMRMGSGKLWELWRGREKLASAPPLSEQAKKNNQARGDESG